MSDNFLKDIKSLLKEKNINNILIKQLNLCLVWDILAITIVKNNTTNDFFCTQTKELTLTVKTLFVSLTDTKSSHYGNMWQNAR